MNVHHGLKALFIHNPRAAGSSIEIALGLDHGHDTAPQARTRHGETVWASYFKFAFVRDPLARLVSTYEFARMERSWYHDNVSPGPAGAHGDAHRDYPAVKGNSLEDCCRMLLADPASLKQPGWLPQTHFIPDAAELDFVGRFETLADDWRKVSRKLMVEIELPRINESQRFQDRMAYHTPFVCEFAARYYRADYAAFGYKLPLPILPDVPDPRPARPAAKATLAHGVVGIAKALTGIDRASDATVAARTAICEACDQWQKLPVGHRCKACGCTGLKLLVASESCPLGKWAAQ